MILAILIWRVDMARAQFALVGLVVSFFAAACGSSKNPPIDDFYGVDSGADALLDVSGGDAQSDASVDALIEGGADGGDSGGDVLGDGPTDASKDAAHEVGDGATVDADAIKACDAACVKKSQAQGCTTPVALADCQKSCESAYNGLSSDCAFRLDLLYECQSGVSFQCPYGSNTPKPENNACYMEQDAYDKCTP
jgi:hypothetical protein